MNRLICIYKGNETKCTDSLVAEDCVKIPGIDSEINIEELDELYNINSTVVYKQYSFDNFDGISVALKRKEICIFTFDFDIAEQLKFDSRYDVGTWETHIPMSEVEKVMIEKEYLIGEKKGMKECYEEDIITFVTWMENYW